MGSKVECIADINASKYDWLIIARILRLWEVSAGDKWRTTTSIEMVLVDEKGVQIHAAVRKAFVKKFERVFKEGSVYSLSGFAVTINGGEYRITNHEFKVNIQGSTKVVLMAANKVPCPGNVFVPFDEILGGTRDPSYLIDVMGILSGIGTERSIERGGGVTKMNVIQLENSGLKLTCALWGSYVDELNKHVPTTNCPNMIVAVFGVKIKEFQGKTTVQNSMHCTKLVFNPQFAKASELRRYVESGKSSCMSVGRLGDSSQPSLADDFLRLTSRKSIADLKHLEGEDGYFVVFGTIKCLLEPHDWWYLACKCQRAVYPDSVAYFCNFCGRRVSSVTARYRIKISVMDDTELATFVLFDRAATALLNKECSDMISLFEEGESELDCPVELSALVDREFLFKVDVKGQGNVTASAATYPVKRLTDDSEIVKSFKGMAVDGDKEIAQDLAEDSDVEEVLPPLSTAVAESEAAKNKKTTVYVCTNSVTPSKRVVVDVVESSGKAFNPKLLKAVKIEKP